MPPRASMAGFRSRSPPGAPAPSTWSAGQRAVTDLVEGSDGLLLLGVILSDTNFAVSERKIDMRRAILAIDREVRVGHHIYPGIPMDRLLDALLAHAADRRAAPPHAFPPERFPHHLAADASPIAPSDIATAVNDLFRAHGPLPIAADMGDCLFTAMEIQTTELVAPGYYAGMGYGVPAGLGMCVAAAARPPDPGRRRRLSDDRVRVGQLPPLRLGPDRAGVQQQQLGNAARVPAGKPLQRPRRLALCRAGRAVGR